MYDIVAWHRGSVPSDKGVSPRFTHLSLRDFPSIPVIHVLVGGDSPRPLPWIDYHDLRRTFHSLFKWANSPFSGSEM